MRPLIRRLLNRKQVGVWLSSFSNLDPGLVLTLVEPDGRVFAEGAGPAGDELPPLDGAILSRLGEGISSLPGRQITPLNAGGTLVGFLAATGRDELRTKAGLDIAGRGLALMLNEAVEARGLAAEALDRYREINLLYRLGETIGTTLDSGAILAHILKECRQIIEADFGLLLLHEPGSIWQPAEVFGSSPTDGQIESYLARVTGELQPAIITDLPEPEGDIGSLLWAPLAAPERLHGGILLGRSAGRPIFVANDQKLLAALSSQAAVAMETARLHQAELARQRMEKELQMGHELQSSLIPSAAPHLEGWEFAVWWHPAREVSGDFCDFTWLEGDLGVVVADVADKGVQAALFMALTRSTVRASLHATSGPSAAVGQANRLIAQDASRGMFVTLCYAQFRPSGNEVTYVNAGHNPPLWLQSGTGAIVELEPTGTFLGFDSGLPFEEKTIHTAPGDIIVFYTDGITEAMNHERVQFGEDCFRAALSRVARQSPAAIQAHLQAALQEHVGDTLQSDDITLVIARRMGGMEE